MKKTWNRIAYVGSFDGHPSGSFTLDTQVFKSIVDTFKRQGIPIPADYNHEIESRAAGGGSKIASGWVHDLEQRADGLYAEIEWTNSARQKIQNKEYAYLSPAVVFDGKDPVSGARIPARLSSIGLTNSPFLKKLKPVLAGEEHTAILCSEISAAELAELADDEGDTLTLAEHELQLSEAVATAVATATEPLALKLSETNATLANIEAAAAESKATQIELENRLRALDDAADSARVAEAFDTYKETKNLSDTDRVVMPIVLKSDPKLFDRQYPKLAANRRFLLRKMSQDTSGAPTLGTLRVVPHLKDLLGAAQEKYPKLTYDQQFDLAMNEHATLMSEASGAMH